MLTQKDQVALVSKVNNLITSSHTRVMVKDVPNAICDFYEINASKINAEVIIVRSKNDEPAACLARNTYDKALFVFSEQYYVNSYFLGVCQNMPLSKALIFRASQWIRA